MERMDLVQARIAASHRELFTFLAEADRRDLWRDQGARDMAHLVSMRYGISWWKADRWVRAAHALESLPKLSEAFRSGELSVDKVVELTRFASPEGEAKLIRWAVGASATGIRRRADVECRPHWKVRRQRDGTVDWFQPDGVRYRAGPRPSITVGSGTPGTETALAAATCAPLPQVAGRTEDPAGDRVLA
jgi:hypothetical protein